MRRHHDRAMQHVRQGYVIDVARAPREEALIFDSANGLTDSEAAHLLGFNMNMFS